jgi:hypothetical protein
MDFNDLPLQKIAEGVTVSTQQPRTRSLLAAAVGVPDSKPIDGSRFFFYF